MELARYHMREKLRSCGCDEEAQTSGTDHILGGLQHVELHSDAAAAIKKLASSNIR